MCAYVCVVAEMPEKRVGVTGSISHTMSLCQETVIKWFANFTMSVKKPSDIASQQQAGKSRLVTHCAIITLSLTVRLAT